MNKIDEKIKIKNPFITIPMIIENPTKPSLYSFFQGLKKVLNSEPYPSWWVIRIKINFKI